MKVHSKNRGLLLSAALIIVLGFVVYGNSLKGKFIGDDESLVRDNLYIKKWANIPNIFTKNIAAGGKKRWNSYRPIQMFSYMADYSLWRLNARGYHLTNILLHILVGLTIFWLVNILYDDALLSLLTSLFFIVHPIHTGAIDYISGRADPLAGLFILLSIIFYIKQLQSRSILLYLLCLMVYTLALLSRENCLVLPAILILYHYTFKRRFSIGQFLPIIAITLIYILLRVTVLKSLTFNLLYSTTLLQRMPGFFAAITVYLRLLLVPIHLHAEYGRRLFNYSDPLVVLGLIIIFSLLIYAFGKRKSNGLIFFSVFWFFITLLPQSNIYPINAFMAEHWLYLPSIGFFLLMSWIFVSLSRKKGFRALAAILTVGLLSCYSYLTIEQSYYWKDTIGHWGRTLQYAPTNPKVLTNLGLAYDCIGEHERAIDLYKQAIEAYPNFLEATVNLGVAYRNVGQNEEAVALFKKAIEINPGFVEAHCHLGLAYKNIGRNEAAVNLFKRAMEINPLYTEAYNNLGLMYIYTGLGTKDEAIALFKKAIEINPGHIEAYNNLGVQYANVGQEEEAIKFYKQAIAIQPDFAEAHNNLAISCLSQNQHDSAIKHFDRAIELGYNVKPKFLRFLKPYQK